MYKTFTEEKKKEVVALCLQHQEADRFVQGKWLNGEDESGLFRGCYFGCMTQTEDNTLSVASEELQIPLWLVHVGERIFEGLPVDEAKLFPLAFTSAIPVDFDTEQIWKNWNIALLTDQLRFVDAGSEQEKAIQGVIDLFGLDVITESAAWSAESAARSAARSAESAAARSAESAAAWSAESAARSAAWSAAARSARSAESAAAWSAESAAARSAARSAESAAESAESAARSAARSAESAAARSAESAAAWSGHYVFMRDTLINLLLGKTVKLNQHP